MKKLLLTLGAVASVAAPVAAVVACSSDDSATIGAQLSTSVKNGSDVKGAFENHITFGEMFNRHGTLSPEFTTLKTASVTLATVLNGVATMDSAKQSERETAIATFITAIETFNSSKSKAPSDLKGNDNTDEQALFDAYKGKVVKAVLFYQDTNDQVENEKGEAFYIKTTATEDWTNAQNDWVDVRDNAKGFDETNSSHKISGDNFGIRFDIVA